MRNHPTCPLYFIRSSRPLCFRAIYAEQTVFKGLNTPKYVSYKLLYICPHTGISVLPLARHAPTHTSHVSIRQHTSYATHLPIYLCSYPYICTASRTSCADTHQSRQHTSAHASIRQLTICPLSFSLHIYIYIYNMYRAGYDKPTPVQKLPMISVIIKSPIIKSLLHRVSACRCR
jgi:hypothetical protein